MVYNTQNYWGFRLLPFSGTLETREHSVSETESVSFPGETGNTPTLLGPLERANLNHWTSPEDGNRSSFETLCFLVSRMPDDGQSPDPINSEYYI
jgi:hypothetical protein